MKIKIKSLVILLIIFNTNLKAQENKGLGYAMGVGISLLIQNEKNKEALENYACNFILENYPQYDQFRIKIIGTGIKGKKLSDDGSMNIVPFKFIRLNNGQVTNDRKLLILLVDENLVNEYGVSYESMKFEFWDVKFWNNIITKFASINSPNKDSIINSEIPVYSKISSSSEADITIESGTNNTPFYYQKTNEKINVSKLNISKTGLKNYSDVIFPFYSLDGDDYIVGKFNNDYKIIANENSIGLFANTFDESIIIKRSIVNKIHDFLNFLDEDTN